MLNLLKIVHLLGLVGAMGMTLANLIALNHASSLDEGARGAIAPLQRTFGAFSIMALAILWLTGIALYIASFAPAVPAGWFLIKLIFVVVLTGLAIRLRIFVAKAAAAGAPPSAEIVRKYQNGVLGAALLVVVSAVVAFG